MSIEVILPVISNVVGRNLTEDYQLFIRARNAVGSTLNIDGQLFISKNYRLIVDWMETEKGKKAISAFINSFTEDMLSAVAVSNEADKPVEQEEVVTTETVSEES